MSVILSSLIGGLLIADATALGQMMFSRPIFAGPLIGFITGDLQAGLYAGMIMELVWITVIPLGNVIPPDASVVAIASAAIASGGEPGRAYLVFIILLLVPFGIFFKKLDMIQREFNVYFTHKTEVKLEEGDTSYIGRAVLESSLLFFLKGFIFLILLIGAGRRIFPELFALIPDKGLTSLEDVFFVLPAVGFGTAITTFIFKKSQSMR